MVMGLKGGRSLTHAHKRPAVELLAPAGGMEQLRAAILFGADAVYLAGPRFGMRARAANFPVEGIADAVRVAHAAGVKVHVTCNVMITQPDVRELPDFLERVDAAGADALIVGDIGAFSLAKKHAPNCELHVSTQASVANAEAAKMWHSLGASRIVCAREMTLSDIASMRCDIPDDLQIEAFVHGAQCMAMSGRCLISSYLADRSASLGDCTQPCRWNYALVEEKRPGEFIAVDEDEHGSYIMNAMDLNMVAHLDALRDAGVDSMKIEGRNKKAFYVATVVNAYRMALDGVGSYGGAAVGAAFDARDIGAGSEGGRSDAGLAAVDAARAELECISHRPYSTGFYFGDPKQADDYDGYEQETLHVADVLSCEPGAHGGYVLQLRCRNRFVEGDELEVLSPHIPVREVRIRNLQHAGELMPGCVHGVAGCGLDGDFQLDAASALGAIGVANRTSDVYSVASDVKVQSGSLLRRRVHRRTARHL